MVEVDLKGNTETVNSNETELVTAMQEVELVQSTVVELEEVEVLDGEEQALVDAIAASVTSNLVESGIPAKHSTPASSSTGSCSTSQLDRHSFSSLPASNQRQRGETNANQLTPSASTGQHQTKMSEPKQEMEEAKPQEEVKTAEPTVALNLHIPPTYAPPNPPPKKDAGPTTSKSPRKGKEIDGPVSESESETDSSEEEVVTKEKPKDAKADATQNKAENSATKEQTKQNSTSTKENAGSTKDTKNEKEPKENTEPAPQTDVKARRMTKTEKLMNDPRYAKKIEDLAKTTNLNIKEGFLMKRGGRVKNWKVQPARIRCSLVTESVVRIKTRWVVLLQSKVKFVANMTCSFQNPTIWRPLGLIPIMEVSSVSSSKVDDLVLSGIKVPENIQYFFFFTVYTTQRDYVFAATSKEEMDEWIRCVMPLIFMQTLPLGLQMIHFPLASPHQVDANMYNIYFSSFKTHNKSCLHIQ